MHEINKTPEPSNNNYVYAGVGIIILALLAWAIYAYTNKSPKGEENQSQTTGQQNQNDAASPAPATSTEPTSETSPNAPVKKLSYGEAIKAYPYRFQFLKCSGNPGSMAVKKGSIVMLDNRDSKTHTIKADGQTFSIPGYDYALLRASIISNSFVTCDGGGAAMLNVEK